MPLDVEVPVLRGFLTPSEETLWRQTVFTAAESGPLLESLMDGDLEAVLLSPLVLDLLSGDWDQDQDLEHYLERRVLVYLDSGPHQDQTNRQLAVLVVAVCCLHLFAQSNWTGPPVSLHLPDLLPPALHSSQSLVERVHRSLLLDGESVYSLVSNPVLLLLARVVLTSCSSKMDDMQLLSWWTLRYVSLHQQILEARSEQLLDLVHCCRDRVLNQEWMLLENNNNNNNMAVQLHLELVYSCLTFYEYVPAKEHVSRAQELAGLDVNLTGALGKRTHFQNSFLPQLVLQVKRKQEVERRGRLEDDTSPKPTPRDVLPKDLNLGDETVLDQINLEDPDQFQIPDLSAEEQAVLLGVCTHFQKNNPVHTLTEEELLAFTSCILVQPKFWAVEVTALCLRTKLERGSSRRVERAMMQTQAIVDHFEDKSCPVTERLKAFYYCQAPPRWAVQKQLASLLMDLGCTSSALLLYQKLELWEDAVICYERLGQHGKAEEIVRAELQKTETPSLYCLLGDILRDHQFYERAWELSGRRSARAMRSKALLHVRSKQFQLAVDCFEQSLHINGMQLGVWFSLGCAYFALEQYEGAARAFQRCVGLEPDNAEAWNNLSTAYIRLQRKDKAFLTLQEALRCNYEQWQIWENFIVVSTDVGEFSEAVKAYHRLMDLRDNYKDVQILQILVRAVVEDLRDRQGVQVQVQGLGSRLRELLGRVTSRHSSDAALWLQYARLYGGGRGASPEDNHKALQFLTKALRCRLQTAGWEKEPRTFTEVLEQAVSLGEVTISCSKEKSNPAESLQMISSTRLSLKSLASKAKQLHVDVASGQIHPELQDGVAALERLVAELQELSGKLRDQSQ